MSDPRTTHWGWWALWITVMAGVVGGLLALRPTGSDSGLRPSAGNAVPTAASGNHPRVVPERPTPEPPNRVSVFAVYDHPRDHPDSIVVREWHTDHGQVTRGQAWLFRSVEGARVWLQKHGAERLLDFPDDDPAILETWAGSPIGN